MMEVTYAPHMSLRSSYYGADEFFEIQGTDGFIWVTRATGEMLDLPPVVVHHPDGTTTGYSNLDADWRSGFLNSSRHFIDALIEGRPDPEMTGELAVRRCSCASRCTRRATSGGQSDPATIHDAVSPPWWPPDLAETPGSSSSATGASRSDRHRGAAGAPDTSRARVQDAGPTLTLCVRGTPPASPRGSDGSRTAPRTGFMTARLWRMRAYPAVADRLPLLGRHADGFAADLGRLFCGLRAGLLDRRDALAVSL